MVAWRNIKREDYVGYSYGYSPRQHAVGTTNGAGAHNLQILVLAADGVVVHALPGFWHPEDLARELVFARMMHRLWTDPDRDADEKLRMYDRLHQIELRNTPDATVARSAWQSFDQHEERLRLERDPSRDTAIRDANGGIQGLVPLHRLFRERLRAQPFRRIDEFDVAAFVDHGRYHYDLNHQVDDPATTFSGQERLRRLRAREAEVEERARQREAARSRRAAD